MDDALLSILEKSEYPEILKLCKTNSLLRNYCQNYPKQVLYLIFKSAGFKNLNYDNLKDIFKFLYQKNKHLESFLKLQYSDLNSYPLIIQTFLLENCKVFNCQDEELSTLPINLYNVEELNCSENKLENEFDFSIYTKLQDLNCSDNNLTKIKLPEKLISLNCAFNTLTSFSNLKLPKLQNLNCEFNDLQIQNLPYMPNITSINLMANEITLGQFQNLFLQKDYPNLRKLPVFTSPGVLSRIW